MTSCDSGLLNYVAVLLYSMYRNLRASTIDFFLFHRGLEKNQLLMLERLVSEFENISFHDIIVDDAESYDQLAVYGGGWKGEAYYSLCAHQYLPPSVDRILYLDAGDTYILDDIKDYYNYPFHGKSLIVHTGRFKIANNMGSVFQAEDINSPEYLPQILRGLFNSGSYVMNIQKMREDGMGLADFLYLANVLKNAIGGVKGIYWGDQGLLSAAYVGDITYWRFPEIIDLWYMPYNFCLWYYDARNTKPSYQPSIIHFAGAPKPWEMDFPICIDRFRAKSNIKRIADLKIGQAEWYYIWHIYTIELEQILQKITAKTNI